MITDSQRMKLLDPGSTERCEIPFPYYKIFATDSNILDIVKEECHSASRGCVPCKMQLAELINDYMRPIRERRAQLSDNDVWEILQDGNQKARDIAKENMSKIKAALYLNY